MDVTRRDFFTLIAVARPSAFLYRSTLPAGPIPRAPQHRLIWLLIFAILQRG